MMARINDGKSKLAFDPESVMSVMAVIDAVRLSSASGKAIRLEVSEI